MSEIKDYIVQKLKAEIEDFKKDPKLEKTGVITEVGDGIVRLSGLEDAMSSEMIEMETKTGKVYGLALNLEEDSVGVVVLGDYLDLKVGDRGKTTGKILEVPVGEKLIGRVVDALGSPIDGGDEIEAEKYYPVEKIAPRVIARQSVSTPLQTGIKAIDSMIPIGRGQRELIIGDRQTGKTAVAIDTIINQKYEPKEKRPICIYVAIGQKRSKTANIMAQLEAAGAMEYTTIIATSASEASPMLFLAPFTGMAVGEYFMEQGKDVLIILDDLSKHAVAYRQMSLLLRRPPGREAYPGDIFYLHSRLLERSAKLSKELGGGSITALPIIETQEGDVSAYIPTNVISITDGQIFLEGELFNKGIRPALNVGISVSRVGSSAQTKAMKSVSGKIRLELAQFRELEAFMQFASDLDDDTKKRIDTGRKYVELLKQTQNNPMPFYKQVVSIYGANNGLLDGATPEMVQKIEVAYQEFILRDRKEILDTIETERAISDELKTKLDTSIADFKEANGNLYGS